MLSRGCWVTDVSKRFKSDLGNHAKVDREMQIAGSSRILRIQLFQQLVFVFLGSVSVGSFHSIVISPRLFPSRVWGGKKGIRISVDTGIGGKAVRNWEWTAHVLQRQERSHPQQSAGKTQA